MTTWDWAVKIAALLNDVELDALTHLLDGDTGHTFYHRLNELNAARNPASYVDAASEAKLLAEPIPRHECCGEDALGYHAEDCDTMEAEAERAEREKADRDASMETYLDTCEDLGNPGGRRGLR